VGYVAAEAFGLEVGGTKRVCREDDLCPDAGSGGGGLSGDSVKLQASQEDKRDNQAASCAPQCHRDQVCCGPVNRGIALRGDALLIELMSDLVWL
jgi:hypothetical protein